VNSQNGNGSAMMIAPLLLLLLLLLVATISIKTNCLRGACNFAIHLARLVFATCLSCECRPAWVTLSWVHCVVISLYCWLYYYTYCAGACFIGHINRGLWELMDGIALITVVAVWMSKSGYAASCRRCRHRCMQIPFIVCEIYWRWGQTFRSCHQVFAIEDNE